MDPVLQAALGAPAPYVFGAVRIAMPGYDLRLLDGSGEIMIGGLKYVGVDPVFGAIDTISALTEGGAEEAPELTLSLLPPDASAGATLANSTMQGSVVTIMVGVMDPASGLIVGVPEVKFLGEIDVPTLSLSQGQRQVEYSIVSVFERLFEVDEGVRASDGWHQSIWPGELGLAFMTGTAKNLYWGAKRPAGQFTASGGSFSGNGNWHGVSK